MHLIETPYLLEEKEKNVSKVIQFDNNDVDEYSIAYRGRNKRT